MINLNDSAFEASSGIFNGGEVGIVEDVVFQSVTKNEEAGWEMNFEKGGTIKYWVNYFNDSDPKNASRIKAVGMQLKHFLQTFYGPTVVLPAEEHMVALIDKSMSMLTGKVGTRLRLHVNYGTIGSEQKYIKLHKYVPFMELASVPREKTKLQIDKRFSYVRPIEDQIPSSENEISGLENSGMEPNPDKIVF